MLSVPLGELTYYCVQNVASCVPLFLAKNRVSHSLTVDILMYLFHVPFFHIQSWLHYFHLLVYLKG